MTSGKAFLCVGRLRRRRVGFGGMSFRSLLCLAVLGLGGHVCGGDSPSSLPEVVAVGEEIEHDRTDMPGAVFGNADFHREPFVLKESLLAGLHVVLEDEEEVLPVLDIAVRIVLLAVLSAEREAVDETTTIGIASSLDRKFSSAAHASIFAFPRVFGSGKGIASRWSTTRRTRVSP